MDLFCISFKCNTVKQLCCNVVAHFSLEGAHVCWQVDKHTDLAIHKSCDIVQYTEFRCCLNFFTNIEDEESDAEQLEDILGQQKNELNRSQFERRTEKVTTTCEFYFDLDMSYFCRDISMLYACN